MSETAGTYHIPVTVIEHQGPFQPTAYDLYLTYQFKTIEQAAAEFIPPTAYDLYLTYQFKTIEQAAAEFTTRVNAHPSVIYIDRTRNIIWIPYAEWWMKEEGK